MKISDAHKVPRIFQNLPFFRTMFWRMPAGLQPKIYLTFDDGPIPLLTPFVLDELDKHKAKATFFCVGDNIRKHPEIFRELIDAGHSVGNHTYNHLNGFKTPLPDYLQNAALCRQEMEKHLPENRPAKMLFRPPYGKITPAQARALLPDYRLVMWEVLTGDFSPGIAPYDCSEKAIARSSNGSIVVFHDNLKAENNLRVALPAFLSHFSERGFCFEAI